MPHSLIGSFSASIDLAGVQAAERDLGRRHQVEIVILDAVDLRLRPARNEADAFQHVAAGQVGRDHRREAFANQEVHRVLLQREFQQRGFVLQEVEAVAGDAGAAFEIDQVVLLGQRDVILHRKAERPHVDVAAAQLLAGVLAADGRLRRASDSASRCGSPRPRPRAARCALRSSPSSREAAGLRPCGPRARRRPSPGRSTCSPDWPAAKAPRSRPAASGAATPGRRTEPRRPSRRGGRSSLERPARFRG